MDGNLAAISALRTIERTAILPRDSDEQRALLGALKALYRLHSPQRANSHTDSEAEHNA
ncbi:hypothetical protein ACFXDI_36255 [Streptomyces mirabilis]|uniref:hypothetical protein n=1 Tax=Streptomyces mirabilis TaxID=68239 RepID=UPI0036760215